MAITERDIDNLHKLEGYLRTPRTIGEIATYLGGVEKCWVVQ